MSANTNQGKNDRIIHVPRRFATEEWGGTETVILEISRQQQSAGWQPEIFTSLALAKQSRETVGGVPVRRFRYCYPFFGLTDTDRFAMDKKGGNLLSLSLFGALMSAGNVRIFHAHALKRMGGEVRTAATFRGKPYVVSLHGGVFDVPDSEIDSMMKPMAGKLEWGKPFGALFGSRRVLEDADHVICVGQSELDQAKKHLAHNRVSYLPNGVDPKKFGSGNGREFRRKYGVPENAFLLLNISRIDAQKNQLLLLNAFATIRQKHPGAFLVMIGPETQPDYAQMLRSRIQALGLSGAVHILPGLRNDDPELVNAYHACDVFALTSLHEPFGIVILEAWSAAKPVVVSRIGGLKTLVSDGENGLSFNPESATELESKLELLASQPELRKRLGEFGRTEVLGKYDWRVINSRLESIYQAAEERQQSS